MLMKEVRAAYRVAATEAPDCVGCVGILLAWTPYEMYQPMNARLIRDHMSAWHDSEYFHELGRSDCAVTGVVCVACGLPTVSPMPISTGERKLCIACWRGMAKQAVQLAQARGVVSTFADSLGLSPCG